MPIVTLTTDFGLDDYYVAVIKGAILSRNTDLKIVDITHNIKNYNIVQAAFIFKNAWTDFPKGSIHILSVNNFYSSQKRFLAIRYRDHFFIGPDNGIFSLLFEESPKSVYKLDYPEAGNFPLKELYADAVGHLLSPAPFSGIGRKTKKMVQRLTLQPVISRSQIRGSVIHIDNFENVIANIDRALFDRIGQGRPFELYFKRHDPIRQLSTNYYDVPVGEPLCLFNSAGYIEIAINMGRASTLLGLNIEDTVQIDFREDAP